MENGGYTMENSGINANQPKNDNKEQTSPEQLRVKEYIKKRLEHARQTAERIKFMRENDKRWIKFGDI